MSGTGCSSCPRPRPGGHRCKSRRCPSCGVLWAGDTRRKLLVNVTAYGGDVALVTVTAPGAKRLPDSASMMRWNRHAPRHWRELHRAASQVARRRHGVLTLVAWTWEYQQRGALHKHVVLGVGSARELASAHTYVQTLHELRQAHDFGFVDRGRAHGGKRSLEMIPPDRASRYVAKYLSPLDSDGKPTLSQTVVRQDVPPMVAYVSRRLTTQTGCTMRWLRFVRLAYVLGIDPTTGEVVRARASSPVVSVEASPVAVRGP